MRHTIETRRLPRFVHYLLLLATLGACQGQGRVHEAPASYPDQPAHLPDPVPARPEHPTSSDDRYAAPPAGPNDGERKGAHASSSDVSSSDVSSSAPGGLGAGSSREGGGADPSHRGIESEHPASRHPGADADRSEPQRSEGATSLGRAARSAPTPSTARSWNGARHRPVAPRPEERPGLATHWGETRYSPARQVDFERSDATRPSAVVELHYDDRDGARRLLPGGQWGRAEAHPLEGLRVRVVDASGSSFPALTSGSRVAFVGAPGERYALSIENTTGARFEVVASVDGLDVLDGESASVAKRGYLIGAWSSVIIDGFRRSDAEVAAFRLGDVARSYAASKGKARNVGVIGVALFAERRPAVVESPTWRSPAFDDTELRRQADPFPGGYARPPVW